MTTAASPPILFIGDPQRDEFRDAANSLIDRGAVVAADLDKAQAIVNAGFAPALIVLAQAWPNQFSESRIDAFRRRAPLARIVRLLGTWMEGDGRSGRPWPATMRANWHRWDARHTRLFPECSLPVTAGEDDRLLTGLGSNPSNGHSGLSIAICCATRESAQSLTDLCTQRGWIAVRLRKGVAAPPMNIDCAVFDARNISINEIDHLAELRRSLGQVPIIALVGFPRLEDLEQLKSAGASAVLAKPFSVDDLVQQIEQLLPQGAAD